MVLKFTAKVASAYWAVKFIPLASAEGLSSQALQQSGIGLIMTMLIITVPTIAALWQGNMGTFMAYSAFNSAASPGPQGQPAGSYMPQQAPKDNSVTPPSSLGSADQRVSGTPQAPPSQEGSGSRGVANQGASRLT